MQQKRYGQATITHYWSTRNVMHYLKHLKRMTHTYATVICFKEISSLRMDKSGTTPTKYIHTKVQKELWLNHKALFIERQKSTSSEQTCLQRSYSFETSLVGSSLIFMSINTRSSSWRKVEKFKHHNGSSKHLFEQKI